MRCGGGDAVFEQVGRFQTQDADGFYADVLVGRGIGDGWVGLVGDGAGKDVGGSAAFVGDVDLGDFDLFDGAVEVEIETGELPDA